MIPEQLKRTLLKLHRQAVPDIKRRQISFVRRCSYLFSKAGKVSRKLAPVLVLQIYKVGSVTITKVVQVVGATTYLV